MMPLKTLLLALSTLFITHQAAAHALLLLPKPRNGSDGIKKGPCGGIPRTKTPEIWSAGSQVTISWRETVDHPGRYILRFSFADDEGFESTVLAASVPDVQNRATLPHEYSATVTVPNRNCDSCTLQLIQSMEENPQAPSYYYSCADVRIVGATTQPTATPVSTPRPSPDQTPGDESKEGSLGHQLDLKKPGLGGCGSVALSSYHSNNPGGPSSPPSGLALLMSLFMPLLMLLALRAKTAPATVRRR